MSEAAPRPVALRSSRRGERALLMAAIGANLAGYAAVVLWLVRRDPVRPRWDLAYLVAETVLVTAALACVLARQGIDEGSEQERARGWHLRLPAWLPFAAYALFVALTIAVTRQFPSGDESAYQFQARIFRSGRLAAEAVPGAEGEQNEAFFFMHHVTRDGRWFSQYFTGWPALLALAQILWIDALLNPLIGLVCLAVLYRLARAMFGDVTAWCATSIYAASASVLFLCSGHMSHPAAALAVLIACGCWWRSRESDHPGYPAGFIASMGLLASVRPYTALCVFVVLGPLMIATMARRRRGLVMFLGLGTLAGGAVLAWHGYYQSVQMGSPLRLPYSERYGDVYQMGPAALGANARRLLAPSLHRTALYSVALAGPLTVIGLVAERRRRGLLAVLVALMAVLVIGHLPVSEDSGMYYGERFYSEAYFAVALLAGRGLASLLGIVDGKRAATATLLIVLAAAQGVHLSLFYWRAYHRFAVPARIRAAVLAEHAPDSVVFYPPVLHRDLGRRWVNGRDLNDNAADWRHASRFYMVDPGPARRARIALLLGKTRWVLYTCDDTRGDLSVARGCTDLRRDHGEVSGGGLNGACQ